MGIEGGRLIGRAVVHSAAILTATEILRVAAASHVANNLGGCGGAAYSFDIDAPVHAARANYISLNEDAAGVVVYLDRVVASTPDDRVVKKLNAIRSNSGIQQLELVLIGTPDASVLPIAVVIFDACADHLRPNRLSAPRSARWHSFHVPITARITDGWIDDSVDRITICCVAMVARPVSRNFGGRPAGTRGI